MASPRSKLTPALEREVMEKAGEGWSARRIADWLKAERSVTMRFQGIAEFLAKTRTERADVAKAIVREKLTPHVTRDIDRLEKHAAKLDAMADRLADGDPELYLKAVEQLRKVTDTKLHYSGADTPDDSLSDLAAAEQRVAGKLARLLASGAEGAGYGSADASGTRGG